MGAVEFRNFLISLALLTRPGLPFTLPDIGNFVWIPLIDKHFAPAMRPKIRITQGVDHEGASLHEPWLI